jgi:hypothetical protein
MLGTLFWVLVGALIGWHFPQPAWAVTLVKKIKGLFVK